MFLKSLLAHFWHRDLDNLLLMKMTKKALNTTNEHTPKYFIYMHYRLIHYRLKCTLMCFIKFDVYWLVINKYYVHNAYMMGFKKVYSVFLHDKRNSTQNCTVKIYFILFNIRFFLIHFSHKRSYHQLQDRSTSTE